MENKWEEYVEVCKTGMILFSPEDSSVYLVSNTGLVENIQKFKKQLKHLLLFDKRFESVEIRLKTFFLLNGQEQSMTASFIRNNDVEITYKGDSFTLADEFYDYCRGPQNE